MIISKKHSYIFNMVVLALLTALILVLSILGVGIKLPIPGTTNISLTLIPIALGAMILGPASGAFLGFVFGLESYIAGGVMGLDFFTLTLFTDHPVMTGLICILKTTLAGLAAGFVFKALKNKNMLLAVFLSAGVVPLVNTGIFILGCFTILDTIKGIAAQNGATVMYFLFIGCAGLNFICEFVLNMVFSPALYRIIIAVKKIIQKNH